MPSSLRTTDKLASVFIFHFHSSFSFVLVSIVFLFDILLWSPDTNMLGVFGAVQVAWVMEDSCGRG